MEYKLEWQGLTLGATQQHEEQRKQQDLHVVRWYVDNPPAQVLLY